MIGQDEKIVGRIKQMCNTDQLERENIANSKKERIGDLPSCGCGS